MTGIRNSLIVSFVVIVASLCGPATAGLVGTEPAVTFPTDPRTGIGAPQPAGLTMGWSFMLDSARKATHLGMYNYNFSGSSDQNREIGLWDSAGVLVAGLTIPAGGGEVDGPAPLNFIYGELASPEPLQAGEVYTAGVWYGGNNSPGFSYNHDTTAMDGLSIVAYSLSGSGGGLNKPLFDYSGSYPNGFFGPNVRFLIDDGPNGSPVEVPEPATILVVFGGLAGLGEYVRRRRMT